MQTELARRLGIEFPIFAFTHCRDVVVAVSKAGGFGVLGAVGFKAEQLEVELAWIDEHVGDKPYGVDIVVPVNYLGSDQGGIDKGMLEAMIPDTHKQYVEKVLDEHHVPKMPADHVPHESLLGWSANTTCSFGTIARSCSASCSGSISPIPSYLPGITMSTP